MGAAGNVDSGSAMDGLEAWLQVASVVVSEFPPHVDVCVPADMVPHPGESGLERTVGFGLGRHYALPLPSGGRLHVKVKRGDCYHVHWDIRDPHRDPLGHLIMDAPRLTAISSSLLAYIADFARGVASLATLGEALVGGLTAGILLSALTAKIAYRWIG